MRPDISEDMRNGWIALGVAVLVVVITFFVVYDGGDSNKKLGQDQAKYDKNKGDPEYPLLETNSVTNGS